MRTIKPIEGTGGQVKDLQNKADKEQAGIEQEGMWEARKWRMLCRKRKEETHAAVLMERQK